MVKNLEELVADFAEHVAAQTDSIWRGDAKTGNKHAKKYMAAAAKLLAQGDPGREALAVLMTHPRMDVRVDAAAYLLRHRTAEARAVLEEAAKGKGLVPFGASMVLRNWDTGQWNLDRIDTLKEPVEPADSRVAGSRGSARARPAGTRPPRKRK